MSPNLGRKRFKIVLSFATFLSGSLSQAFSCSHRLKICNVRLLTHSVMCVRLGHFEPRGKHTKELRVLRVSVGWWEKLSKDTCYCLHWGIPHKLWLFTREIFVCVCVCVCQSERACWPDFSHWAYGYLDSLRGSRRKMKSGNKDGVKESSKGPFNCKWQKTL